MDKPAKLIWTASCAGMMALLTVGMVWYVIETSRRAR